MLWASVQMVTYDREFLASKEALADFCIQLFCWFFFHFDQEENPLYPAFLPPQWKNFLQWPLFIISLFFWIFFSKIFCLVLDSRRVMYCLTSDLFFISWSPWIYHWLNVSSFSSSHWSLESLELSLWSFSSKYWPKVHLGFSINLNRMNELFSLTQNMHLNPVPSFTDISALAFLSSVLFVFMFSSLYFFYFFIF